MTHEEIEKHPYFFTFGVDHPFTGFYVEVIASDEGKARRLMTKYFGQKWCTSYTTFTQMSNLDSCLGRLGCTIEF